MKRQNLKLYHCFSAHSLQLTFFFLPFCLRLTSVPTHCRCRGLLLHVITPRHTQTHTHSIGLPWTSDRPVADTSTWQNTTFTKTNIHGDGRIRTRNPSKPAALDPHKNRAATGSAQITFQTKNNRKTLMFGIQLCYLYYKIVLIHNQIFTFFTFLEFTGLACEWLSPDILPEVTWRVF